MNILNECECECDMLSRECEGYFMTKFNFDLFGAQRRVIQSAVYVFHYEQWSQMYRNFVTKLNKFSEN